MRDERKLKALYEEIIRQYEFPTGFQQSREFGLDLMRRAFELGREDAMAEVEASGILQTI